MAFSSPGTGGFANPFDRITTRSLTWGAIIATLVLAINVPLTIRNTREMSTNAWWLARSHRIVNELFGLLVLVKDAETGARDYAITREGRDAIAIDATRRAVTQQLDTLRRLVAGRTEQRARLARAESAIRGRLAMLDTLQRAVPTGAADTLRLRMFGRGGTIAADSLRNHVDAMIRAEQILLDERAQASAETYWRASRSGAFAGLAALVAFLGFVVVLRRELQVRSRAAREIGDERERLDTTLRSIGDAVMTADANGYITAMNPVAERLTGVAARSAIGEPLERVFRVSEDPSAPLTTDASASSARMRPTQRMALFARDGMVRPIDRTSAAILTANGDRLGDVIVFRDMSEQRATEQRLEDNRQRLQLAMRSAHMTSFDLDLQSGALRLSDNSSDAMGLTSAQPLESLVQFLVHVHPEDRPRVQAALYRGSLPGDPFHVVFRMGDSTAPHPRWIELQGEHQIGRDARRQLTGLALDITDRKRLEDEQRTLALDLSQAARRKDEFIATLAHELRNPLATLRNGVEILRLASPIPEPLRRAREMMERQVVLLVRLVDDLLDVSRITSGKLELRREHVALQSVVGAAVEASLSHFERRSQSLQAHVPPQDVIVDGDTVRLAQVLTNLLDNASKYSPAGATVHVELTATPTAAILVVRDMGQGIPAEQLQRVFELFTQVDRPLERTTGGLGIGLTLVKRLVEMHGGSIRAASLGEGLGSTFTITLPRVDATQTVSDDHAVTVAEPLSTQPIVVCDDNVDAATTLAMILRDRGHEVITVHDGESAISVARTRVPSAMIIDLGMPGLNGFDTARRIRALPLLVPTLLVALTGWGSDDYRRQSREAGFDHHLVKPADLTALDALLATVRTAPSMVSGTTT